MPRDSFNDHPSTFDSSGMAAPEGFHVIHFPSGAFVIGPHRCQLRGERCAAKVEMHLLSPSPVNAKIKAGDVIRLQARLGRGEVEQLRIAVLKLFNDMLGARP